MTNEERARAIRRTWGLNIALAASASKNDLGEACDGLEAAILSALDAATAPLVAERERLKQERAYVCGAILNPHGSLRFIDVISDERYAWDYSFGFPDEAEIARCKKEGYRYQPMHAFARDPRSALAEKEPG